MLIVWATVKLNVSIFSTILVEPNCTAVITSGGDIEMTVYDVAPKKIGLQLDAIQLSIFSHRFMSIAEQMGRLATRQINANKICYNSHVTLCRNF